MAFIDRATLRERLPMEGDGVTDAEVDLAIAAATEQVGGLTGDTDGTSSLTQSAVASLAQARCLDIIMPRDARDRETLQFTLRSSAEADITRYLDIKRNTEGDQDPRWSDVPPVTVTVADPPASAATAKVLPVKRPR